MQGGVPALPLEGRVARQFPFVPGGVSVGGLRVTAGTLGGAAYDVRGGQQLILSNWHVLCGAADCVPGEPIVQPGVYDGGVSPEDTMAVLVRYANTDRVDAAVAAVSVERYLVDAIAGLGPAMGVSEAALGTTVRKSGRTTGVTSGIVDDVSADVEVDGILFRGQISVVRDGGGVIVAGGDSGSLVVDERSRVVGLLFAGRIDGSRLIANHIRDVMSSLQIRFTPEPSPLHVLGALVTAP